MESIILNTTNSKSYIFISMIIHGSQISNNKIVTVNECLGKIRIDDD